MRSCFRLILKVKDQKYNCNNCNSVKNAKTCYVCLLCLFTPFVISVLLDCYLIRKMSKKFDTFVIYLISKFTST